jgi:hypothetical protein
MAWITASNGSNYAFRVAVTCDTTGATPGGAAVVARLTIGPDLAHFWATVQSNAHDVRFATAGGSVITHERATWSYSSKVGVFDFEIDVPATAPAGAVRTIYLYYGPATTVAADPTAGPFANTVGAYAEAGRIMPAGRAILWDSPSWGQSAGSNTPTPAQTAVVGVDEFRHIYAVLGWSLRFQPGYNYNGSDVFEDVDWLYVVTTGGHASASSWMLAANLRLFTDETGYTVRTLVNVQNASDGLAVLRVGWSGFLTEERHYLKLRGIAPAI